MIARAALIAWALAASLAASHGTKSLERRVAEGMVDAAVANPLTPTERGIRTTLAIEVSLAWLEGGNRLDALGDHGGSFCWAQINLPGGSKTLEGWTGRELLVDANKCATVAVRLIRQSVTAGPADCELCVYARGGQWRVVERQARALSDHRVGLARRLLRDVPLPEVAQ